VRCPCANLQVQGFTGHRNSEFGFYAYVPFSVSTLGLALAGNIVGAYIAVDGSAAVDHVASSKFVTMNETVVSADLAVSATCLGKGGWSTLFDVPWHRILEAFG
jgi:hypothetical protein